MVSTASTAVQANEIEKKRKQTLEKAKANHVSWMCLFPGYRDVHDVLDAILSSCRGSYR
jgi:hypothetical protein